MGLKPRPGAPFAAGSMFWGRTEAFAPLTDLSDAEIAFGPELGRVEESGSVLEPAPRRSPQADQAHSLGH